MLVLTFTEHVKKIQVCTIFDLTNTKKKAKESKVN